MQREIEVNGRLAVVHVDEVGKGRWTWSYFIDDGKGLRRCDDRPLPDQEIAMREGIDAARRALGG